MDIASRLDLAMKEAGFESQSALSRASGIPQPTINRILKGVVKKGPEAHTLVQLATACNVTFDWLHEGIEPKSRAPKIQISPDTQRVSVVDRDDPNYVHIKKVKLRLSAGVTGFQADPEFEDSGTLALDPRWVARHGYAPERLIAIKVKGQSMEPSLYEDDLVVLNTADTLMVDGAVFAINYEGEAVIKRLSRDAGEWWLASDNPDQRKFHRKLCRGGDCIIVGRVVRKESDRI